MKYAKKYAKSFSRGKETNFDTTLFGVLLWSNTPAYEEKG